MTNATLEIIKRRRSIRDFRPDTLEEEKLSAIAEAGLYAPNGGGEAWHFTVIQNAEILRRMSCLSKEAAAESPLAWLAQLGRDAAFDPLYGAPALILVSCDEGGITSVYDASAATENILIAAESLHIGSCWGYFITQAFDGPKGEELRNELGIPEGYKVLTSVALGHRAGEAPQAPLRKPGTITHIR